MKVISTNYPYNRALTVILLIAAIYFFMKGNFVSFPFNIPVIVSVIIFGYLFCKQPLNLLGIKKIRRPFFFLLTVLIVALFAETVMDWLIQPQVNKLFLKTPDYSYFHILEGKVLLFIKYIFYTWLSAAIGEELLFRGFMFHQLAKLVPESRAQPAIIMIIASLLFAFAHGYEGPAGIAMTFLWGMLFGVIYKRWGNIWMVILVHGCIDTVFLALAYTGKLSYYELPNRLIWGY